MPLPQAETRTPDTIEDISITLTDYIATDEPAHQSADYSVQVKYDNGDIKVMTGDLVPHLSSGQITALMGFMDDMRTKAEEEILP
jgi:hypothetical protein